MRVNVVRLYCVKLVLLRSGAKSNVAKSNLAESKEQTPIKDLLSKGQYVFVMLYK